jgi:hypothetical protein
MPLVHSYTPWREKLPSNWVPGSSRRRSSPESGKTGGGAGRGGGEYRLGAHYGHIGGRSCGGGSTGERVRRRRPAMAAGTLAPASWRVGQGKKWPGVLHNPVGTGLKLRLGGRPRRRRDSAAQCGGSRWSACSGEERGGADKLVSVLGLG